MKKIICFIVTILGILVIYVTFDHKKINYVSISDNLIRKVEYKNSYDEIIRSDLKKRNVLNNFNNLFNRDKISTLIEDIKNNRTIREDNEEYFLKKVLRESNILILNIGMEELANNYYKYDMKKNNSYFNKIYSDIERLVSEIRKYAKGTILFIGYYNPFEYYDSKTDEFFYNLNIQLNRLMINNKIVYIDMYQKVKGNNFKIDDNLPYLNLNGNHELTKIIQFYL